MYRSIALTRYVRQLSVSKALSLRVPSVTFRQSHLTSSSLQASKGSKGPGEVVMPDMSRVESQVEYLASIPLAPDSYSASSSVAPAPVPSSEPKVTTAAHPTTLPGGSSSISHASTTGDDVQPGESGDKSSSLLPKGADRNGKSNEEGKPLKEEDKKGLWVLGGILGSGYALSVATDPNGWRG
ncbi:hypothetical protein JCM11641_005482 [Rhodosporidiobolus odoratus]